jgi:hypothetical protein
VIVLLGTGLGIVLFLLEVPSDSILTFNPDIFFLLLIPPIILEVRGAPIVALASPVTSSAVRIVSYSFCPTRPAITCTRTSSSTTSR